MIRCCTRCWVRHYANIPAMALMGSINEPSAPPIPFDAGSGVSVFAFGILSVPKPVLVVPVCIGIGVAGGVLMIFSIAVARPELYAHSANSVKTIKNRPKLLFIHYP